MPDAVSLLSLPKQQVIPEIRPICMHLFRSDNSYSCPHVCNQKHRTDQGLALSIMHYYCEHRPQHGLSSGPMYFCGAAILVSYEYQYVDSNGK